MCYTVPQGCVMMLEIKKALKEHGHGSEKKQRKALGVYKIFSNGFYIIVVLLLKKQSFLNSQVFILFKSSSYFLVFSDCLLNYLCWLLFALFESQLLLIYKYIKHKIGKKLRENEEFRQIKPKQHNGIAKMESQNGTKFTNHRGMLKYLHWEVTWIV